ncbi:MAG: HVO_A0114 family putative DNA-binding protein [Thermoplasmatota archaeon]
MIIAPDQVAEVFTAARARIYMVLQEQREFESVSELANRVHRDVSRVSRDVAYLEGFGLLRRERAGKSMRVVAEERPVLVG